MGGALPAVPRACIHVHTYMQVNTQNPDTWSMRLWVSSFRLLKGQEEPSTSTEHTWNPGWKCRSSLKDRQFFPSSGPARGKTQNKHASSFLCQKQRRHFKIKNRKCQRDRGASLQKLPLSKFRRVAFWWWLKVAAAIWVISADWILRHPSTT